MTRGHEKLTPGDERSGPSKNKDRTGSTGRTENKKRRMAKRGVKIWRW